MGNTLIVLGVGIVIAGVIINFLSRHGVPTLPGDIFIQKENFTFYFPIVTSIIVSIILTIMLNLFRKP